MTLAAGRLRRRVTIQETNQVDNGRGGRTTPPGQDRWRDVVVGVAAEVIPLRGDEALRHSVERAVQLWRVTIRPRDGVSPRNRLLWGGVVLDIKSAALNPAGDELVMTCESGAHGA